MKGNAMKKLILTAALAACATAANADEMPGLSQMTIEAPHHGRPMDAVIWYPASGGKPTVFGENPVFEGAPALEDAKIGSGRHPVVLLSHGLGGNIRTLGWLAAGLAKHGAVVIAVNHPNSTTRDFDLLKGLDHWTRAQDLTAALESISSNSAFAGNIDTARVYAAGFSYGGWTALSLGGLRGNLGAYAKHCTKEGAASTHCRDIAKGGVDLNSLDAARWNASYKDIRVKAVAVIDPALTWGLGVAETKDISSNVLLIGLGAGKDRLFATDFSATGSGFEKKAGDAKVRNVAPASHFAALSVCKPDGEAILAEEKDDPVCTDAKGADRKAVHEEIIAGMAAHFGLE
jgi:predicted dienelactone hydrolase